MCQRHLMGFTLALSDALPLSPTTCFAAARVLPVEMLAFSRHQTLVLSSRWGSFLHTLRHARQLLVRRATENIVAPQDA